MIRAWIGALIILMGFAAAAAGLQPSQEINENSSTRMVIEFHDIDEQGTSPTPTVGPTTPTPTPFVPATIAVSWDVPARTQTPAMPQLHLWDHTYTAADCAVCPWPHPTDHWCLVATVPSVAGRLRPHDTGAEATYHFLWANGGELTDWGALAIKGRPLDVLGE